MTYFTQGTTNLYPNQRNNLINPSIHFQSVGSNQFPYTHHLPSKADHTLLRPAQVLILGSRRFVLFHKDL
jgi:hypothetical protein